MRFCWLALAFALGLATAGVGQLASPLVRLRESVEIKSDTIRLSDLLPSDAPPALKTACAAIELGRAPLPGSPRVLTESQLREKLAGQQPLLAQLALAASMTVRRTGWPISRAAIAAAVGDFLQQQGWRESDLPHPATLAWTGAAGLTENSELEVTAAQWDSRQRRLRMELRCVERSACGSFVVTAPGPHSASEDERRIAEKPSPSASTQSRSPSAQATPTATGSVLTQPGDSATLILESNSIRISLAVICLQRGYLNQEIRARDAASQRVYHAEVVGMDMLRAPL